MKLENDSARHSDGKTAASRTPKESERSLGLHPAEMPVHRRLGDRASELPLEEFVDHVGRSTRLLFLQSARPPQHVLPLLA